MKSLRTVVSVLLLAIVVLAVLVFASRNPGTMALDIGVVRLEHVPIGVAFAAAFGFGWAIGLLFMLFTVIKGAHERHRLERRLRHAEAGGRGQRDLPIDEIE